MNPKKQIKLEEEEPSEEVEETEDKKRPKSTEAKPKKKVKKDKYGEIIQEEEGESEEINEESHTF